MVHKKRVFLVLLTIIAVTGFIVGVLLSRDVSVNPEAAIVADTDTYKAFLKNKFGYLSPDEGQGSLGAEFLGMNGSEEIQFNLYNDMGSKHLPVFAYGDMEKIAARGMIDSAAAVEDAFVMLRPNERLVLEFLNFKNRGTFEIFRNGVAFTEASSFATAAPFSWLNVGTAEQSVVVPTESKQNIIAINGAYSLRGVFTEEGYYRFKLPLGVPAGLDQSWRVIEFGFYLMKAENYQLYETSSPPTPSPFNKGMLLMQNTLPQEVGQDPNSYYYDYSKEFPFVHFDNQRFEIDVLFRDHNGVPSDGHEDELTLGRMTKREFNKLGSYTISVNLGWYDAGKKWTDEKGIARTGKFIRANTWTVYELTLSNFGFQAHYYDYETGEYAWFGGEQNEIGETITSDVTRNFKGRTQVDNYATNPDLAINYLTNLGLNYMPTWGPVVTNQAPVTLRYNVPHLFDKKEWEQTTTLQSRVAYKAPGKMWELRDYKIGQPYEDVGTYIVLVYFTYPAARNFSKIPGTSLDYVYFQVFYFNINNIVADVRIAIEGVPNAFTYEQIIRNGDYATSAPFSVYSVKATLGGEPLGPYECHPKYSLTYYKFGSATPEYIKDIEANVNLTQPVLYSDDGIYVFSIYFGNTLINGNPQSRQDFTVIVDTSPIDPSTYKAGSTNPDSEFAVMETVDGVTRKVQNVSVFGSGLVSLAWGAKESGVGMREVLHTHYPVAWKSPVSSTDTTAKSVKSGWVMADVDALNVDEFGNVISVYRDKDNGRVLLPATIDWSATADGRGYELTDKLNGPGIHVLNIIDGAGNENIYVIIIDTTSAGFAQNPEVPTLITRPENPVNVHNTGVTVGMGLQKVVPFSNDFYNQNIGVSGPKISPMTELFNTIGPLAQKLIDGGVLVETELLYGVQKYGFSVPVKKASISTDNREWVQLDNGTTKSDGAEKLYTATKNNSSYFVLIENSLQYRRDYFIKVEDHTGNVAWHYVQINPDRSQGMVFEDSSPSVPATASAPSPSSGIVQEAGLSNAKYLTFSLIQQASGAFQVSDVDIYFYPLNYETDSQGNKGPNFPFSTNHSNHFSYNGRPGEGEDLIMNVSNSRLYFQLFRGSGEVTRRGLYAIKRTFVGNDDKERWYYVIVDDNPIILPSGKDDFQTGVTINFGSKTARDADFKRLPVIQSNEAGTLFIPTNGKYSKNVFSVVGNMNNKPFNCLNLSVEFERWVAEGEYVPETITNNRLGNGRFKINLSDGAGGFLWNITTLEGKFAPPNTSTIEVDIMIAGPLGTFWFNNVPVVESAYVHDKGVNTHLHSARLDTKPINNLSFEFFNDSELFLSMITGMRWKRNDAAWTTVNVNTNPDGRITYDIPLADQIAGKPLVTGDVFIVELTSSVATSVFECVIDNELPHYNRDRVRAADPFINDSAYQTELGIAQTSYNNYPFAVSNDFVFQHASREFFAKINNIATYNPFIDTARATWTEVDNTLSGAGEQLLDYTSGKKFSEIVDLKPDQNRFFKIKELDEVGAKEPTVYFIQLRGSEYRDSITVLNDIRTDNNNESLGVTLKTKDLFNRKAEAGVSFRDVYGMSMVLDDVQTFYNNNLFFEIKLGDSYVRRFGDVMTFSIPNVTVINDKQSGSQFIVTEFAEMLQKMLDSIMDDTAVVSVNNRFNSVDAFKFNLYHISADTPKPVVVVDELLVGVNSDIDGMPSIISGANGLKYTFQIYDISKPDWEKNPPLRTETNVSDVNLSGLEGKECVIVITDKFGRQLFHEYNGLYSSRVEFNYNSTAKVVKGDLYIGDKDGLTIVYSPEVYDIIFYEKVLGNDVMVSGMPPNARVTDESSTLRHVRLVPGVNDRTNWKIVAVRKGLNAIDPNYVATVFEFNFYSWLPDVQLTNLSREPIDGLLDGVGATGIVVVSYSNIGRLFNSVISYSRKYDNPNKPGEKITDHITMSRSTSTFNLTQPGEYKLEIMNEVWARAEYSFEIVDVNNTSYKVFLKGTTEDEDKELKASPVLFNGWSVGKPIPIYWIVRESADGINDISININGTADRNEDCKIKIVTSMNTPRNILGKLGNTDMLDTIYERVDGNTVVYRLQSATEPSHVFFFAVAVVTGSQLEDISCSVVATGSTTNSVTAPSYYRVFTQIAEAGIVFSLRDGSNKHESNVTYVDYWRNEVYCGRLIGTESLIIHEQDYGIYKFEIFDWAGNIKKFESGVYDHFTIINLTEAPLVINGETIVDGMVYNDKMELNVLTIPYHMQTQNFITKMSVSLDRAPNWFDFVAGSKAEERQSFTFTTPGVYQIYTEFYTEIGSTQVYVKSMHNVYLLSSTVGKQGFSYGPYSNIEIVGVRHNGVDIRRDWADKHLFSLELNMEKGGNGIYLITVEVADDGIREAYRKDFIVVINNLPFIPGIIHTNIEKLFGSSTTSAVQIFASPRIPEIYGETIIVVERITGDGEVKVVVSMPINWHNASELENPIKELNSEQDGEGVYQVRLESPNGGVFFSEAFQLGKPVSGLTYIVIVLFAGGLIVAVLAFVFIRTKLRAK